MAKRKRSRWTWSRSGSPRCQGHGDAHQGSACRALRVPRATRRSCGRRSRNFSQLRSCVRAYVLATFAMGQAKSRSHALRLARPRRLRPCRGRRVRRASEPLRPFRSRRTAHVPRRFVRTARSAWSPDGRGSPSRCEATSGRCPPPAAKRSPYPGTELPLRARVESRRKTYCAFDRRRRKSRDWNRLGRRRERGANLVEPPRRSATRVGSRREQPATSRALAMAGWRIFRHDLTSGKDTSLINGIQPSISPDGKSMAYSQGGLACPGSRDVAVSSRPR